MDSLGDLWDNNKKANICVIRVPEGEEKELGEEKLSQEITAENFPSLVKDINLQFGKHSKSHPGFTERYPHLDAS